MITNPNNISRPASVDITATVSDNATVSGTTIVRGTAMMYGGICSKPPLYIQGSPPRMAEGGDVMEIKRWDTGAVIISGDASLIELIVRAVQGKTNLFRADLSMANLSGANLSGADLSGANLSMANLFRADLSRADLYGADLYGANLFRANLSGANGLSASIICTNQIVPEAGSFTVFKKVYAGNTAFIAELIVPSDAKRISGLVGRKCRVSAARVIDVKTLYGEPTEIKEFRSGHDSEFIYRVGDLVEPRKPFCDDLTEECASGVHCFITRLEAVQY